MMLDRSGLFSFLDKDSLDHLRAVQLMQNAKARHTHNYVVAELIALGVARRFNRSRILAFTRQIVEDEEIQFHWVGESEHRAAMDLLNRRADKNYSLCDAVSFILMKEHGINEARSNDHHFEQEGFTLPLKRG